MVFEGQPVFLGSRCFGRPANSMGGTKGNLTSVQKWSGRYKGKEWDLHMSMSHPDFSVLVYSRLNSGCHIRLVNSTLIKRLGYLHWPQWVMSNHPRRDISALRPGLGFLPNLLFGNQLWRILCTFHSYFRKTSHGTDVFFFQMRWNHHQDVVRWWFWRVFHLI